MGTILITRPREDAERTAAPLRNQGFDVVCAPLLEVQILDTPLPLHLPSRIQAFVATSANGVRALAKRASKTPGGPAFLQWLYQTPLYTVGTATAQTARKEYGFRKVYSANGTGKELLQMLQSHCPPCRGSLFYSAGSVQRIDLARLLRPHGLLVDTEVSYHCIPLPSLPADVLLRLHRRQIDLVPLYSPRTARIYLDLTASVLARGSDHPLYLCFSPAVSKVLRSAGVPAEQISTARECTQEALFTLLPSFSSRERARSLPMEKEVQQKELRI